MSMQVMCCGGWVSMDIILSIGDTVSMLLMSVSELFLYYRILKIKVSRNKHILALVLFFTFRFLLLATIVDIYLIRIPLILISSFVFMRYTFIGNKKVYLFWLMVYSMLGGYVELSMSGIFLYITDFGLYQIWVVEGFTPSLLRMAWLNSLTLVTIAISYMITIKIEKSHNIEVKEFVILLLIVLTCHIPLIYNIYNVENILAGYFSRDLMLIVGVSLLIITTLVIFLYNYMTASQKEKYELQLQAKIHALTETHSNQILDVYGKLEDLQHDLRNHFGAITGYLDANKYDDVKKYVEKITKDSIDIYAYCKNPVLNALISAKARMAKEEDIAFSVNILLPPILPISDVDLCILAGNVLDNAFEAKNDDIQGFYVDFAIKELDSYCVVSCKNKSDRQENFTSLHNLQSTKTDKEKTHGIGTRQIQRVAEETGGFVTYKHEDGEFSVLVMLKL